MSNIETRLDALRPSIARLMEIGGTPGLSLGVIQRGKPIYQANFGFQDVNNQIPFSEESVTPVCSFTKAVTAAALGILVEEKKAEWDTLVKDALPGFEIKDETLQNCVTITDLLCHRAGMAWGDNLFMGTENNVLISGENAMAYLNSQTRLLPFRGQHSYNNLAFELAGKVIEALSGQSYFDFVQTRILDPLGMDRTFLKTPPSSVANVSLCYNALDDGTSAPITCVKAGDDWFGTPSVGMRSCMLDLFKLYSAFLAAFNDQFENGTTSTEGIPLKQVSELMSAKIPMDQPSRNEISYALGWGRVQTPGRMGQIGLNPGLMLNGMPVVGKGVSSQLVIFHQGSLPGALAVNILLPQTETAIVVTSNALALNDVPDWVGQLVLEEVLEVPQFERNDYIRAAETSRAENLKWYPDLIELLAKNQTLGTSPRSLDDYVGTYWDSIHVFKIVVTVRDGALHWLLQGLESERFPLTHYENDTFTWLVSRNELSRRGRWVGSDQGPEFWKVEFKPGTDGQIESLYWVHDNGVPAVEYKKK